MNIPIDKFPVNEKTIPAEAKASDPVLPPDDPKFDAWYVTPAANMPSPQQTIQGNFLLRGHEAQIRQALAGTWYSALVAYGIVPPPQG